MKTGPLVLVATLIGFAGGYVASQWINRHPPIPAPPDATGAEVRSAVQNVAAPTEHQPSAEELATLKKEIEDFRKSMAPMRDDFHARIDAVLTPEQRITLERIRKNSRAANSSRPKLGEPGWAPTGIIYITASVDRLAEEVGLNPEQKEKIRALYEMQRARFLEFTDKNPPPSLRIPAVMPEPSPAP